MRVNHRCSMEPALGHGQTVYVNRRAALEFGSMVLYKHENGGFLLGRLAALPGERVLKDKQLYRNGAVVQHGQNGQGGQVLPRVRFFPAIIRLKFTLGPQFCTPSSATAQWNAAWIRAPGVKFRGRRSSAKSARAHQPSLDSTADFDHTSLAPSA